MVKICNMTIIMVGMQDSLLVLKSSNTNRYKIYEYLRGTNPQSIAFDPIIQTVHIVGHLAMGCGKPMIAARLGIVLEKILSPVHM